MKLNMAPLVLLLPLLMSACDSQQPSYSASNANSVPPPQPAVQAPPPPPAEVVTEKRPESAPVRPAPVSRELVRARPMPTRPDPLPPVNAIGIGGCDDFINRYRTCVNTGVANGTIPVSRRSKLVRAFNVQVRQWQADLAAGNTSSLVTSCAEADKKARPELVQVGCSSF
ncbi:MAG TPA: hypothetical protein VLB69_08310 [Rudaea sp.]|nr:hypothetical protein [Rudaea sp.]